MGKKADAQERASRLAKGYAPVVFVSRQQVEALTEGLLSQLIAKVKADDIRFSLDEDVVRPGRAEVRDLFGGDGEGCE